MAFEYKNKKKAEIICECEGWGKVEIKKANRWSGIIQTGFKKCPNL